MGGELRGGRAYDNQWERVFCASAQNARSYKAIVLAYCCLNISLP